MTCRETIEFLMDFLDHDLPAAQRAAFESHLAACPPCVEFLRSYEQTRDLECRCFQDEQPPVGVPEALVQAILSAKRAADAKP